MKAMTTIKRTGLVLATACAVSPASASAAEFHVTRGDDPALNVCPVGDCSLRGAIVAANGAPGADVVVALPGSYSLTVDRTELTNFPGQYSGDLDVTDDLTIQHELQGDIVIDASGALDRGLELHTGNDLSLTDVVIGGGTAPVDADNNARGGGIKVNVGADLLMQGGGLTGNHADGSSPVNGLGGGIYTEGGVILEDALVNANTAKPAGFGGGLYFTDGGVASVYRSTFRSNEAAGGGAISGANDGYTSVNASRIGRNLALSTSGGGVFVRDRAKIEINNSNVDSNQANGSSGGAIRAIEADVELWNTTVTNNAAPDGGGISSTDNLPDDHSFLIGSTIVAGNRDIGTTGETYNDCRDVGTTISIESSGYNLVGSEYGCSIVTKKATDQIGSGVDGSLPPILPFLEAEAYYGGPNAILSNALMPESPAVDAGMKGRHCRDTEDIRGVPRPVGKRCDIGAYELVRCAGVVVNRVGTDDKDRADDPHMQPTAIGDDGFIGLEGSDGMEGGDGGDGLCGGAGDDTLKGDAGKDRFVGGKGRDVCIGGPGKDKAKGCEVERSIP
jgi:hypothetical protein